MSEYERLKKQKDEIVARQRTDLEKQIESLKAITELAVEALNRILDGNFIYPQERTGFIKDTLKDIERLQNG
jgi:hypothetical protein